MGCRACCRVKLNACFCLHSVLFALPLQDLIKRDSGGVRVRPTELLRTPLELRAKPVPGECPQRAEPMEDASWAAGGGDGSRGKGGGDAPRSRFAATQDAFAEWQEDALQVAGRKAPRKSGGKQ